VDRRLNVEEWTRGTAGVVRSMVVVRVGAMGLVDGLLDILKLSLRLPFGTITGACGGASVLRSVVDELRRDAVRLDAEEAAGCFLLVGAAFVACAGRGRLAARRVDWDHVRLDVDVRRGLVVRFAAGWEVTARCDDVDTDGRDG